MNKLWLSRVLMTGTILLIAAFQYYWLQRLYKDEWQDLKRKTDVLLKETIQQLQAERLKKNNNHVDSTHMIVITDKQSTADSILNNIDPREIASIKVTTNPNQSKRRRKAFPFRITDKNAHTQFVKFVRGDSVFISEVSSKKMNMDSLRGVLRMTVTGKMLDSTLQPSRVSAGAMGGGGRVFVRNIPNATSEPGIHADFDFGPPHPRISQNFKSPMPGMDAMSSLPPASFKKIVLQVNALVDSLRLSLVDSSYATTLKKNEITVPYHVTVQRKTSLKPDSLQAQQLTTNYAFVGFNKPYAYQASFGNPANYLLNKVRLPLVVSILLIAMTVLSFVYLYRNLVAQQKLAGIKNEFISNITHELKTPIATVTVAIEALRNFGGMQDARRTREYLDISASELQRLSLLVDKVLKLSMFENKSIDLQKETFDLKLLVTDVVNTMRLQFEKHDAHVSIRTEGDHFSVHADKLHIMSVVYNLLDNAVKYSPGSPMISVSLVSSPDMIELRVADHGMGIPAEYHQKVFEKFFRVPTGDRHNTKGYGLGLSYVSHIIRQHGGSISVESGQGKGSTFIIQLPVT